MFPEFEQEDDLQAAIETLLRVNRYYDLAGLVKRQNDATAPAMSVELEAALKVLNQSLTGEPLLGIVTPLPKHPSTKPFAVWDKDLRQWRIP